MPSLTFSTSTTVGMPACAGEARRLRGCRRLVAIDEQHAAGGRRLARHLRRASIVSPAWRFHRTVRSPVRRVDDHDGELAGGATDIPRGRHIHALVRQARTPISARSSSPKLPM